MYGVDVPQETFGKVLLLMAAFCYCRDISTNSAGNSSFRYFGDRTDGTSLLGPYGL